MPDQLLISEEFDESWKREWIGMPEYMHGDLTPVKSVIVHFSDIADAQEFAKAIGKKIYPTTKSIWYPDVEIGHYRDRRYTDDES